MNKKANIKRHARHIVLKEIGGHGQNLIANAKVAIIGAGGLGAPCALYLAAAGVGQITIIDDDKIELSNLQRQILYKTKDIGKSKVQTAKKALQELDEEIEIIAIEARLNEENAKEILKDSDVIIDGCDNFKTRHIVNKAAFELQKVLISGAIGRFEGQIMAFDFREKKGPCYQCFVPPIENQGDTCSELGVVGALCGIIGSTLSLEAIKYISGNGCSLFGKVLIYDALDNKLRIINLTKDNTCKICASQ